MDPDQKDASSEQLEDVGREAQHVSGGVPKPANLAALSEAEFAELGRRATLKMDLVIMPVLIVMYILNYLDRQNIASAKLASIEEDLGLSDVEYQTVRCEPAPET